MPLSKSFSQKLTSFTSWVRTLSLQESFNQEKVKVTKDKIDKGNLTQACFKDSCKDKVRIQEVKLVNFWEKLLLKGIN